MFLPALHTSYFFKSTLLSSLLVFAGTACSGGFLKAGFVHVLNLVLKGNAGNYPKRTLEGLRG